MKKLVFYVMLIGLLFAGMMSVGASEIEQDSTVGAIAYDGMMFNPNTGSIVRGKDGDVVIPSSINGVPVTRIGTGAFAYNLVKSLYIPDSVTSIGENAFSAGFYDTVEGGNNVKEVGGMAFNDSDWANNTQGHLIVGSVYIGYNGYEEEVVIPEGITAFSSYMDGDFRDVVKKVYLPSTLEDLSKGAFRNCKALEEVVFNSAVPSIGTVAFEGCKSLKRITLPEGVIRIEESAFKKCGALEEIVIPASVTEIGDQAFYGCNSLKSFIIPPNVKKVGFDVVTCTNNLESIYVYGADTAIEGFSSYAYNQKLYCVKGSSAEAVGKKCRFDIVYIEEDSYNSEKTEGETTSFGSKVSEWAKEEVENAYENNLVPESLVGFDLTKKVSRSEFAAIAVQLYTELSGDDEHFYGKYPFDDITNDINRKAILDAYYFGFTLGVGDRMFAPDNPITREQLATMLCRVIKKYSLPDWTIGTDSEYYMNTNGAKKFEDDADISDYARNSVYYLSLHGIIKGVDETHFAPKNTTTQQEAAGYATATREQAILLSLRIYKLSDL